ncbi:MAG: hypothetical protein JWP80_718, partial [Pseudomonas sp.]|nr:hypothetical protein [Pseudomonas sp.]
MVPHVRICAGGGRQLPSHRDRRKRAAARMSLIQSAKLNGHDAY